ncbi:trehalose-phosphatase [Sphingomonas sp. MMS12-HWE2-04]|uniref:trehalose-phosphatase n=1 Tax=Sphingomonas sp. MMS12-HWE2-04 TaxID=3234199 RepID=UPI00384E30BD
MESLEVDALAAPPIELLADASLFLDFDGTLVELAARPDSVRVDTRLATLMERLHDRLDGRLALITGRGAGQVRALFDAPRFTVAGSHGLEFLYPDGRTALAPRPPTLDTALAEMRAFAAARPGLLVEDKPLGAALHYRCEPEAEADSIALAQGLAARHGLYLQTGKMMIELRAGGGDKGEALRLLMASPEMAGTVPVFLGDDDTDEPGFIAAALLGGAGVLIGDERPTAARYRLSGVAAVLDWLEEAAA